MGENPTLKTKRKKSNCTKKYNESSSFIITAESMTCQRPVLKTSYAKYNHVSVIPRATAEDLKTRVSRLGPSLVRVVSRYPWSSLSTGQELDFEHLLRYKESS